MAFCLTTFDNTSQMFDLPTISELIVAIAKLVFAVAAVVTALAKLRRIREPQRDRRTTKSSYRKFGAWILLLALGIGVGGWGTVSLADWLAVTSAAECCAVEASCEVKILAPVPGSHVEPEPDVLGESDCPHVLLFVRPAVAGGRWTLSDSVMPNKSTRWAGKVKVEVLVGREADVIAIGCGQSTCYTVGRALKFSPVGSTRSDTIRVRRTQ